MTVSTTPTNPFPPKADLVQITGTNWGANPGHTGPPIVVPPPSLVIDAEGVRSAAQNYSLTAIAIDPSSTVGIARIVNTTGGGTEYIISPERPLISSILGPWYLEAVEDTWWRSETEYYPIGGIVKQTFGDWLNTPADTIFEIPTLVLTGYLKPPKGSIGGPRARLVRTYRDYGLVAGINRIYPVGGRSAAFVSVKNIGDPGTSLDASVSGFTLRQSTGIPGDVTFYTATEVFTEFTLAGPTTLASGAQTTFSINPLNGCEFIALRLATLVGDAFSLWETIAWDLGG